jgi:hypothetical protein
VSYLLLFLIRGESGYFSIYLLMTALMPWTKREGLVLWLASAIAGALVLWKGKHNYRFWIRLGSSIGLYVVWRIFLAAVHATDGGDDFVALNLETIRHNAGRLVPIAGALLTEATRLENWSVFWLLVIVALAYRAVWRRDVAFSILSITFFVPIMICTSSYLLSSHQDYFWHIGTSLPRLLMQLVPVAWLLIALCLRASDQPVEFEKLSE